MKIKKDKSFKSMIFTSWQFWLVFFIVSILPAGQSNFSKGDITRVFISEPGFALGFLIGNLVTTLILFLIYFGIKNLIKIMKKKFK